MKKIIISIIIVLLAMSSFQKILASPADTMGEIGSVKRGTESTQSVDIVVGKEKVIAFWWLTPLVTFVGIIVTAVIIIWQIGRQYRIVMELQKDNTRQRLNLEIYNYIRSHINLVSNTANEANSYLYGIPSSFITYRIMHQKGIKPVIPKQRSDKLIEINSELNGKVIELMTILEDFQIVNPHLYIFHTAFNTALYDLHEKYEPMFHELLKYLPIDVPEDQINHLGTKVMLHSLPNDEQLKNLERLINDYGTVIYDILMYLYDLRVEAQNLLLGDLFKIQLSPREPTDPNYIVIKTDPETVKNLIKYFEEETAWGKHRKEVDERVRKELKPNQTKENRV